MGSRMYDDNAVFRAPVTSFEIANALVGSCKPFALWKYEMADMIDVMDVEAYLLLCRCAINSIHTDIETGSIGFIPNKIIKCVSFFQALAYTLREAEANDASNKSFIGRFYGKGC